MGGKVNDVSSSLEFDRITKTPKLTVVDFYATWCGPCKAIAPEIERMATSHPNVNFVKVDVDKAQDIASRFGVTAMPTFLFFKNGSKIDEVVGANASAIRSKISKYGSSGGSFPGTGHRLGGNTSNTGIASFQGNIPDFISSNITNILILLLILIVIQRMGFSGTSEQPQFL